MFRESDPRSFTLELSLTVKRWMVGGGGLTEDMLDSNMLTVLINKER